MGRIAKRLPTYSSNGPRIEWSPTDAQFRSLQQKLGGDGFSKPTKKKLIENCRTYLELRRAELGAGKQSEAFHIWRGTKKDIGVRQTVERLIALGEGRYPRCYTDAGQPIDAGQAVKSALFEGLRGSVIQLTSADFEPLSLNPTHSKSRHRREEERLYLKISSDFMMRLAAVFRDALKRAEVEFASWGDGFKPGESFSWWAKEMLSWAEQRRYSHGLAASGQASRFSEFLFALHGMLPSEMRESRMASAEAMNQRLRRVLRQTT